MGARPLGAVTFRCPVIGHPDFRFSNNTPEYDQYDYDIECKLVRVKRKGKSHDYCKYYVTNGIQRFQQRIYVQSEPSKPKNALKN